MPELPEVEVIVRELRSKLIDETIKHCTVLWNRTFVSEKGIMPVNTRIRSVSRKGKYIIIHLTKGTLIIHLRMTGQIIITTTPFPEKKHLRAVFKLHSGKHMYFFDSRKFGRIYYTLYPESIISKLGMDALDPGMTEQLFMNLLNNRRNRIKSFLLDQRFLSGMGNIYIDETLFKSGIHPESKINLIPVSKRKKLFKKMRTVLSDAIDKMGTTISDYKTTGGGFGTNQNYLSVYDRENLPCPVCRDKIRKIRVSGRGTHFCPTCQPQEAEVQ